MEDRLLVRVYSVGFGDCIYVRIPDDEDHFGPNTGPHRFLRIAPATARKSIERRGR